MRGSPQYQCSMLTKQIFQIGAKKEERVDPLHVFFKKVASFLTMRLYKKIWLNLFFWLKDKYKIKDIQMLNEEHIVDYLQSKIQRNFSILYIKTISSAISKLGVALEFFAKNVQKIMRFYDFSARNYIVKDAIKYGLLKNNYRNRAYQNPEEIIKKLKNEKHQIAAQIQLVGGARIKGVEIIKFEQLKQKKYDCISNEVKGVLITKEKGGRIGEVLINIKTYDQLLNIIQNEGIFKIDRQKYYRDIKRATKKCNVKAEGTHGFRWCFAQKRMQEYLDSNYSYKDSLLKVSFELKHNRSCITEYYLYHIRYVKKAIRENKNNSLIVI